VRVVKLIVEYDGGELCGWQRQNNGPTVQGYLEDALAEMLREPTAVLGASRTDAGVHATGQVACFRTDQTIPADGFRRGLNGLLPASIAVRGAEDAALDFHARFSARGKRYRYSLLCRPDRSPLSRRFAWHRPRPLDLGAMRAGAACLVGEHDFSAFRAAGCTARHARRAIWSIDLVEDGERLVLEVTGNAFLRNMVRIVAGTLVQVGEGRMSPAQVGEALASRERSQAGPTAPPQGLCLAEVFYQGGRDRSPTP
jgi:tRNA pseudouridine38-40 synthase